MSFGGSVLAMIISLKNNARPKKRLTKLLKENSRISRGGKSDLVFKKVSADELAVIKEDFRKKHLKEKITGFIVLIVLTFATGVIMYKVITHLQEANRQEKLERKILKEKHEDQLYEKYLFYLNDGYKWLNKEEYYNAKFQFRKANDLLPGSYESKIALATAYVYDCVKNKIDCETSREKLFDLTDTYLEKTEVQELLNYYNSNNVDTRY